MNSKHAGTATALSLPKGGAAIKGMGETFQANLFSGTGRHSLPLNLSPGRGGFGPALALDYSAGNGNGLFGLGWQLSLARITRKTEKGLPRYDGDDVFVMSGAEDLVPCLEQVADPLSGEKRWVPQAPIMRPGFVVYLYRPRTEGAFARIERWVASATGETHWRTLTRDNVTSLFGCSAASRLADSAHPQRVHEWLLEESFDAFGNHCRYDYAMDDPALHAGSRPGERLPDSFEQRRVATQRYIRRICYGNLPEPLLDEQQRPITYADGSAVGCLRAGRRYAFEVVFDYGDWNLPSVLPHPAPAPDGEAEIFGTDIATTGAQRPVPLRADRFSSFRAGFEIRTLRRCRRVLMFHHFAELGAPTLVRSTDFGYQTDPDTQLSLLSSATVTGFDRDEAGPYRLASLPPVTFAYTAFQPQAQRCQPLRARGGEMPALALSNPNMALVDLYGDGLPDILHSGPAGFVHWRNLGNGQLDRPRALPQVPAGLALDQPGIGFGDMTGNGLADLLVNAGPLRGFFSTTPEGTWKQFTPCEAMPDLSPQGANVRMVDLTGDGRADILITGDRQFLWLECLGERGFAAPRSVARRHDLDHFPDLFFDDPAQRVRLADMTGDGLNDIVWLHNGGVDYWPNLGYGRFGPRISMAHAPRLEADFDPKRLFLADLNGSGCADLVYVDAQRLHFWFNQSGNAWSGQHTLRGTPRTDDASAVAFADLFGTGCATLLWSRDFGGSSEANYKALDFCGGHKPYVLTAMDNNMGTSTRVSYGPSTRHFLEDQARGRPWIAPLPFPVQVVDKVEVIDEVGKTKRVSTYRYHHGHYDGREREFCGFARVDQFDTESFEDFAGPGLHGDGSGWAGSLPAHHVPPVETRTWFHTGVYLDARGRQPLDHHDLGERLRREYNTSDHQALPLPAHAVETGDTPAEAYRALRGAQVRREVFGRDGSAKADLPYLVSEGRCRVIQLQPRGGNHHAVYFCHPLENLTYHCERRPADPRISHALTLRIDAYGNPLQSLDIRYGRRHADAALPTQADRDQQTRTHIVLVETRYTNAITDPQAHPDSHRTPAACEVLRHELTGFRPAALASRFSHAEWVADDCALIRGAQHIAPEVQPSLDIPQQRLLEHTTIRCRSDDLSQLLPLGVLQPLALAGETRQLVFSGGLLAQLYGSRVDPQMLQDCGYVPGDDDPQTWWAPSGRAFCSPEAADTPAVELAFARRHFFAIHRVADPFGNTVISSLDRYALLATESRDPLGNRSVAENDYRVLQPKRITDANGNRSAVVFDTLGLVAGSAVMGKDGEALGDSLAGFEANLSDAQRAAFFADPLAQAPTLMASATTRVVHDLARWQRERLPVCAAVLSRETHASEPVPADGLRLQLSLSYADGFGREIQKKIPAEPGPLSIDGPVLNPRWVGSGWVVFNNKGQPVKRFEPFFDDSPAFRFERQTGLSSTLLYDALGRAVATLHPDQRWEKVVFDPWQSAHWDANDTLLIDRPQDDPDVGGLLQRLPEADFLPTWYAQRQDGALGAAQQAAAAKTVLHAGTPALAHADALGRPFFNLAHNRYRRNGQLLEELLASRVTLDIDGHPLEAIDALGRSVMRWRHDLRGHRVHEASMEAGERLLLIDVAGQPAWAWDSRGHRFRNTYDALRRPLDAFLQQGDGAERLIGRTVYGEAAPDAQALNLRGKVYQRFDQAGVVTNLAHDFKGNLLGSQRQFAADYKKLLDWSSAPALETQVFVGRSRCDALNRPVELSAPDGSVFRPQFNAAGLLERMAVHLQGAAQPTTFVQRIDYDAKGRRSAIVYGNGVRTDYRFDPRSQRLTQCLTRRGAELLQDLSYTHDPAGNITHIQDDAQQSIYFRNQVATPSADYSYDAIYRLLGAEGREHIGQASAAQSSWNDAGRIQLPQPGDGQAMRRYSQAYEYDAVGNLLQLVHQAANGSWTRRHSHQEASLIAPGQTSNRLSTARVGSAEPEVYAHDAHGNITAMPHLAGLQWDFRDQLRQVDLGGGGSAYYVYDAAGQRTRKVVERNGGTLIEERLTLGGFEVFRRRNAAGQLTLERETLQVMDGHQRIALVENRSLGDEPEVPAQLMRYQIGNHLGSAALELDAAGRIISYEEYYPYGSTSYQAGRSVAEVSLKRYRHTAMERDEETGLNYHGARYYAPWLGRWTSCDPLGIKDGPNSYLSFHCNPVIFTDPDGCQNEPANFVKYAASVKEGLVEMARLGYQKGVEYGLASDPTTGKLMILSGTNKEVVFGADLIPLGHSHTGTDSTSGPSTDDFSSLAKKNVKEHWIFGRDNGWARLRYDAKTQSFEVRMVHEGVPIRFKVSLNPNHNPADTSPMGRASKWIPSEHENLPPSGGQGGPPGLPRGIKGPGVKAALQAGARTGMKVVGAAGVASMVGDVAKNLHEENYGAAATSAGIGVGLGYIAKRYPPAMILAAASGTILAYDDKVKAQSNSAGEALDDYLGFSDHSVIGAANAASYAVQKSVYNGVFKPVGTGIGEGAAVVYIRLTSDQYTRNPFKSQAWADFKSLF